MVKGHSFISKGFGEDGKERFDVEIRSNHDLLSCAKDKREYNSRFIKHDLQCVLTHVDKNGKRFYDKLNPEYVKRAENLKEIRKKLREEFGSHIGESVLFNIAKDKDFKDVNPKTFEPVTIKEVNEKKESIWNKFRKALGFSTKDHRTIMDLEYGEKLHNYLEDQRIKRYQKMRSTRKDR